MSGLSIVRASYRELTVICLSSPLASEPKLGIAFEVVTSLIAYSTWLQWQSIVLATGPATVSRYDLAEHCQTADNTKQSQLVRMHKCVIAIKGAWH